MKRLVLIFLLISSMALGQSSEIRRPMTDADSGASGWAIDACGAASAKVTTSGALAYDDAGQATSVLYSVTGSRYASVLSSRLFSSWNTPANPYSALQLNVNSTSGGYANLGAGTGAACVVYSLDSGINWATLACDAGLGWAQTTNSVTLSTTQDLTKLRVAACIWANSGGGVVGDWGSDNLRIYDIWTTGTIAGTVVPGGKTAGQANRGAVIVF